jgi:hypothetical protein
MQSYACAALTTPPQCTAHATLATSDYQQSVRCLSSSCMYTYIPYDLQGWRGVIIMTSYAMVVKAKTCLRRILHSVARLGYWALLVLAVWTAAQAAAVTVLLPTVGAGILQLTAGREVRLALTTEQFY